MAKITVLRVIAKSGSFRRAGYQFTSTPTDIPLAELKPKDRQTILDEPALVTYETDIDDEPSAESNASQDSNKSKTPSGKK